MGEQLDIFGKLYELEIEIFATGKWNGDDYTEADLENMVENFSLLSEEVKPPVKLGHNDAQVKDGQPALGWVSKIKKAGNKIIATLTQVPEIVYKSIKAGRYKRVSSEIYWNYKGTKGNVFKRVLSGVALLGADIPAVTNLADLEAYLTQQSEGSFDSVKICTSDIALKTNKNDDGNNQKSEEEIRKMDDQEKKSYESKIAELEAKAAAEKAEKEKTAEKLKLFEAEQKKKQRENHEAELKTFTEELVKEGRMLPAYRDNMLKDFSKLPYSEKEGFSIPVEFFKNFVKEHKIILDKTEHGQNQTGGETEVDLKDYRQASQEIHRLTEEFQRANKVDDYEKALDAVLADPKNRELADAYTKYVVE